MSACITNFDFHQPPFSADLIFESLPAAIAVFDREMNYLRVTRKWSEAHGCESSALIGNSHYALNPNLPDEWKAGHRRCLKGAVESSERDPYIAPDGSLRWIKWRTRPWRDLEGQIGGLVMEVEDITAH